MSTLGKQSIARFVKFVLEATWWAAAIGLGLLVLLRACSFFIEMHGNNLTMSLPVAVQVDAPIHDVGGEKNAHFEKLRGNLLSGPKGYLLFGQCGGGSPHVWICVVDGDAAPVRVSIPEPGGALRRWERAQNPTGGMGGNLPAKSDEPPSCISGVTIRACISR
jgi:hypothetical protein